jgi:hypothetical protein
MLFWDATLAIPITVVLSSVTRSYRTKIQRAGAMA